MTNHLLLVGMMGAGKSTVGRRVAARLGRPCVDTDAEVEADVGLSVAAIFAGPGEEEFRRLERAVVLRAIGTEEPIVVSVGGGAVLDPANRAALRRAGTVVWLRARPETLARRVGQGADRPLLSGSAGGPAVGLARIDAARRGIYEELADAVVDVDDLDPDAVAERVLVALRAEPSGDRR